MDKPLFTLSDGTEIVATVNEDVFELIQDTVSHLSRERRVQAGRTSPNSKAVRALAGKRATVEKRQDAIDQVEAEKGVFRELLLMQTIRWALIADSLFTVEEHKREVVIHCVLGEIEPDPTYWDTIRGHSKRESKDQFRALRQEKRQGFEPRINQREPHEQMFAVLSKVMDEEPDFADGLQALTIETVSHYVNWLTGAEENTGKSFRFTSDGKQRPGQPNGAGGDTGSGDGGGD